MERSAKVRIIGSKFDYETKGREGEITTAWIRPCAYIGTKYPCNICTGRIKLDERNRFRWRGLEQLSVQEIKVMEWFMTFEKLVLRLLLLILCCHYEKYYLYDNHEEYQKIKEDVSKYYNTR